MKRFLKPLPLAAAAVLLALLLLPAGSYYYQANTGPGCARCHEIREEQDKWHQSTHRGVGCDKCHGGLATLNVRFHWNNLQRLATHVRGDLPEQIRLKDEFVDVMVGRCRSCHQQEFAQWSTGPHGVAYQGIFLDKEHNTKRRLMDDCLRCHGMLFEGGIGDLVAPIDARGPWRFLDARNAGRPAIPCLACHQMHREGMPLVRPAQRRSSPGAKEEIQRPSLALFDRREMAHVSVDRLPLPAMKEGARPVKMSPDQRQALCYQCHAPLAQFQVASGDDRTPVGVHEGLSCLACHQKHRQTTRASCSGCHPRLSNCGLDVEKMDTTFLNLKSRHNVHFVKCADCHPKGVPKSRNRERQVAAQTLAVPALAASTIERR